MARGKRLAVLCLLFMSIFLCNSNGSIRDEIHTAMGKFVESEPYIEAQKSCSRSENFDGNLKHVRDVFVKSYTNSMETTTNAKCWMLCMLKSLQLMSVKASRLKEEPAVKMMQSYFPDYSRTRLVQIVRECRKEMIYLLNNCQIAYKVLTCAYTKLQESKDVVGDFDETTTKRPRRNWMSDPFAPFNPQDIYEYDYWRDIDEDVIDKGEDDLLKNELR